jgi:tripartite-type tricarboxylate transporter receptor subunit TctC
MKTAFAAILCALLAAPSGASAEQRVITLIVPYAAGGGVDVVARAVVEQMQQRLGATIIIDNKPGASGNIGSAAASRAAPDGHTLLMVADPPFTANVSLMKNVPYDPIAGFTPVGEVCLGTMALAANTALPPQTTQEFVSYAKARPGALNFASSGVGTPHHLAMELFKRAAGLDLLHVPFRDNAGAISALVGGHVPIAFLPLNVALPLPKDKVRIYAAASRQRTSAAPALPTLIEQGFADVDADVRFGLLAPPGTPREMVMRLNAALNESLKSPAVSEKFATLGIAPTGGTPEHYRDGVARDLEKWRKVVTDAGIKVE